MINIIHNKDSDSWTKRQTYIQKNKYVHRQTKKNLSKKLNSQNDVEHHQSLWLKDPSCYSDIFWSKPLSRFTNGTLSFVLWYFSSSAEVRERETIAVGVGDFRWLGWRVWWAFLFWKLVMLSIFVLGQTLKAEAGEVAKRRCRFWQNK